MYLLENKEETIKCSALDFFGKGDKKEDYFLYTSAHHSVQSKTSKIKLLTILSSSIIPHSSSDFEKPSIHHIKCV